MIRKMFNIHQNMRNLSKKNIDINIFFDNLLFFEFSAKIDFIKKYKNTVFQFCSFPLLKWCIICKKTYARHKSDVMLEKSLLPCANYQ